MPDLEEIQKKFPNLIQVEFATDARLMYSLERLILNLIS